MDEDDTENSYRANLHILTCVEYINSMHNEDR